MELALAFNQERHLVAEELRALFGVVPSGARTPLVFRINAPIAHDRIERALNAVIRRHSALRTAYGPSERYTPTIGCCRSWHLLAVEPLFPACTCSEYCPMCSSPFRCGRWETPTS